MKRPSPNRINALILFSTLIGCTSVPKKIDSDFSSKLSEMVKPKLRASLVTESSCPSVSTISAPNGTVFTFAQPTKCVKSVMGEPICAVPFQLTSISVSYSAGRNGYMFNIPNHPSVQRFDERAGGGWQTPQALPISFNNVGDSLVAVQSEDASFTPNSKFYYDGQPQQTYVKSAAVLSGDSQSRVCNAQPFGDYTTLMRRAPWGDKSLAYDIKDFLRILPLPTFARAPGLDQDLTHYYSGSTGMQAWEGWSVRMIVPADKEFHDYGNYRSDRKGQRMLAVLQEIGFEYRLPILLGLAQDAIDTGAAYLGGAVWQSNGGHNHGPHYLPIKVLGWLTGDQRFKFVGPLGVPRVGEQFHFSYGQNFYVPSHTVIYKGFDQPSPATKSVSAYTEEDKRQISYMLCCGTLNTQSGYIALNILGQMDPIHSATDKLIMDWVKQWRGPFPTAWSDAVVSVGGPDFHGWWGNAQPMANYFWPYFGW